MNTMAQQAGEAAATAAVASLSQQATQAVTGGAEPSKAPSTTSKRKSNAKGVLFKGMLVKVVLGGYLT